MKRDGKYPYLAGEIEVSRNCLFFVWPSSNCNFTLPVKTDGPYQRQKSLVSRHFRTGRCKKREAGFEFLISCSWQWTAKIPVYIFWRWMHPFKRRESSTTGEWHNKTAGSFLFLCPFPLFVLYFLAARIPFHFDIVLDDEEEREIVHHLIPEIRRGGKSWILSWCFVSI